MSITNIPLPNRPEPISTDTQVWAAKKDTDRKQILDLLMQGEQVLVEDRFQTGLDVLSSLKKQIIGKQKTLDFAEEKEKRRIFRDASNRLLIPIEKHRIALKNAPDIGWLSILYSQCDIFFLPLPQIQGLNSSWQWYQKGIQYPMLPFLIKPYYGVYFPTRIEHLLLFEKWLKNYSGEMKKAMDIGTGCGVLAFMLLQKGFKHVSATDINPNAIVSVLENAVANDRIARLNLEMTDLFGDHTEKQDLIVFNPPWIPSVKYGNAIDEAVYYQDRSLFERFFEGASKRLKNEGQLIFIFSNFAQINHLAEDHPVENELEKGGRFHLAEKKTMRVKAASSRTKRTDHRNDEEVELWVLQKK